MGDVPSRRPSSSPVHGCLAPAVQLICEQDLAPPSTHDLRLTRPQASSPLDMMDLSTLENGSELSGSWYQELCRPSPPARPRDPGPFVAGGAGCVSSEYNRCVHPSIHLFWDVPSISESAPMALMFTDLPTPQAFMECLLCAASEHLWSACCVWLPNSGPRISW